MLPRTRARFGIGRWPWVLGVPVACGLVAGLLYVATRPPSLVLQGEVDATRVIVAPKITARIAQLNVRRGDHVTPGQMLMRLESPELRAQLAGAQAEAQAAHAGAQRSTTGSRAEDLRAAEEAWRQSAANVELARIENDSSETLARQGFISHNALQRTRTALEVAERRVAADRAYFDKVRHGDRAEDHAIALAQLERARAAVAQVDGLFSDTVLIAPRAGEVNGVVSEVGELATPARPVLTLVDLSDAWFVFNVREDLLEAFRMGAQITVRVPALDGRSVPATVFYIAALGDFATRRATRAAGDFDLKTFEVHARPAEALGELRPGMSAIFTIPRH